MQNTERHVSQIIPSQATSDGDGVKIRRVAGFNNGHFSPFLMIDELKSDQSKDYVGGFPPHPHRGIETLTYMLQGHFQHEDHMGNIGQLRSGGAQWMAAGQGVIHSEMPMMQDGQLHGFQIWINQPARDKMKPAKYFDFQPELITERQLNNNSLIRVLAGDITVNDVYLQGPLTETGVPATVADWRATSKNSIKLSVAQDYNVMMYVYQGEVDIQGHKVQQSQLALLDKGQSVQLNTSQGVGLLIFIGEPINEPIAHYGPFVMNTMDEIEQAINDYQSGKFHHY